jgi:hypothetical protein
MTIIDEKEVLEIEKLKSDIRKVTHDTQMDMRKFDIQQQKFEIEQKRFNVELSKKRYEAWRLSFYGITVGAGGTFAIAKTLQLFVIG